MKKRVIDTAMAVTVLLTPALLAPSQSVYALSSVIPNFSRVNPTIKLEAEKESPADSEFLTPTDEECYRTFVSLHELDLYYENKKDYLAEEKVLLSCMRILNNSPRLAHIFSGTVALKLSNVYVCLEKFPQARHYITLAIAALTDTYGQLSGDVAIAYNNLGWIDFYQHRPQDAIKHMQTAAAIAEELYGRKSALYFWISGNLTEVNRSLRKTSISDSRPSQLNKQSSGQTKNPTPKPKVPHRL